jgi:hypothetical protein
MRYPPFRSGLGSGSSRQRRHDARAHRIAVTTGRGLPLFADFRSGAAVAAELALMQASGLWDLLAWVLLPCRFDALIGLQGGSLDDTAPAFLGRAALRVMHIRGNGCGIWDERYRWQVIDGDTSVAAAARAILRLPLRAQLTERLADYPFWDSCWVCPPRAPQGRRQPRSGALVPPPPPGEPCGKIRSGLPPALAP